MGASNFVVWHPALGWIASIAGAWCVLEVVA